MDQLNNYCLFIPARKGSKGIPGKNRKLVPIIISNIPEKYRKKVIISTNDEQIVEFCQENSLNYIKRSEENSNDCASMKSVLLEIKSSIKEENIIVLYPTYPERRWEDIVAAISFYEEHNALSLLCSKKANVTPYLMCYKKGIKGKQVIPHDLYRRQDYPEVFEISHFVSILNKKELKNLNNNLYNEETIFMPVRDIIDVDYESDLKKYEYKNNSGNRDQS